MNEDFELDLKEIIHILINRWWIILICFVISVTAAGVISFAVLEPVYKAETMLFVGKEHNSIGNISLGDLQISSQLVNDYREMIKSRLLAEHVIQMLGLDMKVEHLQERIQITTVKDARFFKISFESTNPQLATDIVNTYAEAIIQKAKETIEVRNIQVFDAAEVPVVPIKPNKKMNVAVAGLMGIALGAFVIMFLSYMDQTIKNDNDVNRHLALNVIGAIPRFEGELREEQKRVGYWHRLKHSKNPEPRDFGKNLIVKLVPKAPAAEAYRSLRTNLSYSSIDTQIKSIVITSPAAVEGKSTTAANIALCFAQAGKKVLLMDADLRKPKLHKYFGLPNDIGLTDAIRGLEDINDIFKKVNGLDNLYLICSGAIPPNPSEVLETKKMKMLLNELKNYFDMVVIDTPPAGQLTDAAILGRIVDGVLLVIASAESNIDMCKHSKETLENVGAKILGVVLTKLDKSVGGAYYYKYYGYSNYYYNNEN